MKKVIRKMNTRLYDVASGPTLLLLLGIPALIVTAVVALIAVAVILIIRINKKNKAQQTKGGDSEPTA